MHTFSFGQANQGSPVLGPATPQQRDPFDSSLVGTLAVTHDCSIEAWRGALVGVMQGALLGVNLPCICDSHLLLSVNLKLTANVQGLFHLNPVVPLLPLLKFVLSCAFLTHACTSLFHPCSQRRNQPRNQLPRSVLVATTLPLLTLHY